jgi:hypothetical protein
MIEVNVGGRKDGRLFRIGAWYEPKDPRALGPRKRQLLKAQPYPEHVVYRLENDPPHRTRNVWWESWVEWVGDEAPQQPV